MANDQQIKELHKKVDFLHSHFTARLVEKEKEIYGKIIDYFSRLGHDMHIFKQEVLDEPAKQSDPKLVLPQNVRKTSKPPRKRNVTKQPLNMGSVTNQVLNDPFGVTDILDKNSIKLNTLDRIAPKPLKSKATPIKKTSTKAAIPKKSLVKKSDSKKGSAKAKSVKTAK